MNTLTAVITIILVLILAFFALIRAYIVREWLKENLLLDPPLRKYNVYLIGITTIVVIFIIANIDNGSPKQNIDSTISTSIATIPERIQSIPKEYIKGNDTIRLFGTASNSYDLYTSRDFDNSDIQILKAAMTYMKLNKSYTHFLYLNSNQGEDYYAYFDGSNIHPKVTKEVLNGNLLSDLKSRMTISSRGDISIFLEKIVKARSAINNNISNKEEFKKALSTFQKTHFPIARKAYYLNKKEELWEKDIEVKLDGRNITFIGHPFFTNKAKKEAYKEYSTELFVLRFKTVGFKAFDGDDRTYWELNTDNDSKIY